MFNKNNKIIDERQELQSLKNTKISWIVITVLLALSIIIKTSFFNASSLNNFSEIIILLIGCFFKLILDARQGLLFTKEMQNTKFNIILYIASSLIGSSIVGIGNYLKYGFSPINIFAVIIPMFVFMLGLMLICDYFYRKSAKHRIKKLNEKLEKEN